MAAAGAHFRLRASFAAVICKACQDDLRALFCEKCAFRGLASRRSMTVLFGEPTKGNFSVAQEIIEDQKRRNAK